MEKNFAEHWPCPFFSLTMEGCLEKDVTEGGTVYNFSTINGCGMANTVDSLTAIKHCVFEERAMTLPKLAALLRENFSAQEPVRQRLLHAYPKFGNDEDEPDELMNELTYFFCQEVSKYSNERVAAIRPASTPSKLMAQWARRVVLFRMAGWGIWQTGVVGYA